MFCRPCGTQGLIRLLSRGLPFDFAQGRLTPGWILAPFGLSSRRTPDASEPTNPGPLLRPSPAEDYAGLTGFASQKASIRLARVGWFTSGAFISGGSTHAGSTQAEML